MCCGGVCGDVLDLHGDGLWAFVPFFFFNDTATTEIYTLSLHDALPISPRLFAGRPLRAAHHARLPRSHARDRGPCPRTIPRRFASLFHGGPAPGAGYRSVQPWRPARARQDRRAGLRRALAAADRLQGGARLAAARFVSARRIMTPEDSYAYCRRVARTRARNFYYSFLLLSRAQRNAMSAVYAFMRHCDDLSDEPGANRASIEQWRATLDEALAGRCEAHPILPAFHD